MERWVDLKDKIGKYYKFTPSELRGFIISIIVIAFIISFNDWGPPKTFDFGEGIVNLFNALLITTLTFLFRESVRRISALSVGYKVEYQMWPIGLLFGIIIIIISKGTVWIVIPGGFLLHHLAGHRLGFFRYGLNYFGLGVIALIGPLSNIVLAMFFSILKNHYNIGNTLISNLILLNIAFALFSMIPLPPLDGSKLFFGSRLLYVFSLVIIVSASILLLSKINVWLTILISLLIGMVCWLLYYVFQESKIWGKGPWKT
jgi:Zn-dependent protease